MTASSPSSPRHRWPPARAGRRGRMAAGHPRAGHRMLAAARARAASVLDTDPDLGPEAYRLEVDPSRRHGPRRRRRPGSSTGCRPCGSCCRPDVYRAARIRDRQPGRPWPVAGGQHRPTRRGSPGGAACSTWPGTSCPRPTCCASSTCWPCTSSTCCTCTSPTTRAGAWRCRAGPGWSRSAPGGARAWSAPAGTAATTAARTAGSTPARTSPRSSRTRPTGYVTVVPEVDMPGHMRAAIAAYPELGSGCRDRRVDVVGHLAERAGHVRPGPGLLPRRARRRVRAVPERAHLHRRRRVPDRRVAGQPGGGPSGRPTLGLPGPEALQPWFTAEMAGHLAGRGRRIVAWDEVLDGGAPAGTLIAAWRGPEATVRGGPGRSPGRSPARRRRCTWTTASRPTPTSRSRSAACSPWRTCTPSTRSRPASPTPRRTGSSGCRPTCGPSTWTRARAVDYMAFPRLCALAEVAWSGPGRDAADFAGRLRLHKGRLRARGVEYRRDDGPLPWQTRPDARGWPT